MSKRLHSGKIGSPCRSTMRNHGRNGNAPTRSHLQKRQNWQCPSPAGSAVCPEERQKRHYAAATSSLPSESRQNWQCHLLATPPADFSPPVLYASSSPPRACPPPAVGASGGGVPHWGLRPAATFPISSVSSVITQSPPC
jgi:hypothetical protein